MENEKVEAFLREIVEVCRKHGLVLTVSAYDSFQVWQMDQHSDHEIEHLMAAEDMTTSPLQLKRITEPEV